jgi:hypothetical protein
MIEVEHLRILKAFKDVEKVDFNQLKSFIFDEIEKIEIEVFN